MELYLCNYSTVSDLVVNKIYECLEKVKVNDDTFIRVRDNSGETYLYPELYFSKIEEEKKYYPVLDNGFVGLVDVMGDDSSIVQAARVSYGKGTKSVSDDRALIRYLMNHKHTTPFEMVVFKFHIAMPIHCHRQFIRHRMSTTNEYSARYSEVPEVTYDSYELQVQSKNNKQGRAEGNVGDLYQDMFLRRRDQLKSDSFKLYNDMVNENVAREIARMHLPLNTYTYFYWKIDLHNLFHFLRLRCDSHAQWEIRQYANTLAGFVKQKCPDAFEAWYDYIYGAVTFSRKERHFLKSITELDITSIEEYNELNWTLDGGIPPHEEIGLSKREFNDFWNKLKTPEEQDFTLDETKLFVPENNDV